MAYLVLMEGEKKGMQFELPAAGQITIGRNPSTNSIAIDGLGISGSHGMIVVDNGSYTYIDVGSTNGSFVNDEPTHEAKLYRGDVILLGTTPVMIEGEDVPAREGDPSLGGGFDARPLDIRPRTVAAGRIERPKDFGKLSNHNVLWKAVIILGVLVALAALGWYLSTIFDLGF